MARRQEIARACRLPPPPTPLWPPRHRKQSHDHPGDRRGSRRKPLPATHYGYRLRDRRLSPELGQRALPPSRSPFLRGSTARARSCGKFLKSSGDRFVIAERHDPVADDLAGFMALAGNQQDVAGLQFSDGPSDRLAPIADLSGAGRCSHDSGADRRGILAAGIVVGDNYAVGFSCSDRAHQRPLAGIAIAPGAEHDEQTSATVRTQCFERLCQCIWLVRVIDKDLRPAVLADTFETSFGTIEAFERGEYRAGILTGGDGETGRDQRILRLEFADQRQTDPIVFALMFKLQFLAKTVAHRFDKPDSASFAADRSDRKTACLRRALH